LRDVLPRAEGGAQDNIAMFVDGEARVIAATGGYAVGDKVALPAHLLNPDGAGTVDIVELADGYHAAGARRCFGYREFRGLAVTAVMLRRLGDLRGDGIEALPHRQFGTQVAAGEPSSRVVTFACAGQWLAATAAQVVEAVDADSITRMPGNAPWYSGVVRFADGVIPVIDLARWNGAAANGAANTIVVVKEGGLHFGLLVDQLGEVLEIGAGDVVEVELDGRAAAGVPGTRVARLGDVQDAMVPVVDIAALAGRLRS
jgi:chemotaxis signal transduction protein